MVAPYPLNYFICSGTRDVINRRVKVEASKPQNPLLDYMSPIIWGQNDIPAEPGREVIWEAFGGPRAGSEGSEIYAIVLKVLFGLE